MNWAIGVQKCIYLGGIYNKTLELYFIIIHRRILR